LDDHLTTLVLVVALTCNIYLQMYQTQEHQKQQWVILHTGHIMNFMNG